MPVRRPIPALPLFALISLIGMGMLVYATHWGVGVSPDSTHYISAARNLLGGRGLGRITPSGRWVPLVHWPPLFPVLLAGIGLLGIDPAHGARWLNVLIFGLNLLLIGFMIWRHTGRVAWGAAAAALTLVASPLLLIHVQAWSEPVFLLCALGGIAALAAYLSKRRMRWLVASGLLVAFALLGRYAAISLLPTGCMAIVLFSRQSHWKRLQDCLVFALIAGLPIFAWSMRNKMVSASSTDRSAIYHGLTPAQGKQAAETVRNWAMPDLGLGTFPVAVSCSIAMLMLLALLAAPPLFWARTREAGDERSRLPYLLWLFSLIYMGTILASVSYFDAGTPLDDRILSPVYAAGLLLAVCVAHRCAARWPAAFRAGVAVAIMLFIAGVLESGPQLLKWHRSGIGMNRRLWVKSATLAEFDKLRVPKDAVVYSNGADAIEFRTGRPVWLLPGKTNEATRQSNPQYAKEIEEMGNRLRRSHGFIVLFHDNLVARSYLPTEDDLRAALPLRAVRKSDDGAIYSVGDAPATSAP